MRSRWVEQRAGDRWGRVGAALAVLLSFTSPAHSGHLEHYVYQLKDGTFYGARLDLREYVAETPTVIETNWDPSAEIATDGDKLFMISGGNLYVRSINGLILGPRQSLASGGWDGKIAAEGGRIYQMKDGNLYLWRLSLDSRQLISRQQIGTRGWYGELAVGFDILYLMAADDLWAAHLSNDGTLAERIRRISRGSWYGHLAVGLFSFGTLGIYQSVGGFLYVDSLDEEIDAVQRAFGPQRLGDGGWSGKIAFASRFVEDGLPTVLPQLVVYLPEVAGPHNLLANGSFELPDVSQSSSGWYTYGSSPSGDALYRGASIPGWRIPRGNIDVKNAYWRAPNHVGEQSIDLAGSTPGTIEQAFPTVPGRRYLFSGFVSHNPGIREGRAFIYLNGSQVMTLSHRTPNSQGQMNWSLFQLLFTAVGERSTLTIIDVSGSANQGIALDGLAVHVQ